MNIKDVYKEYIKRRYEYLVPHSAVRVAFGRRAAERRARFEAEVQSYNLDLSWKDNGRYGGYRGTIPTQVLGDVRSLGFDPEHLTVEVWAQVMEWDRPVEKELEDPGFTFSSPGGGWNHHEDENRPHHTSQKVDLSGPRERSDWRWITPDLSSLRIGLRGNAWAGMSAGVRADVLREAAERDAEQGAERVRLLFREEAENLAVEVRILWRGEVIGTYDIGGCEVLKWRDRNRLVAEFICDNGIIGSAMDAACQWADDAVQEIRAKIEREEAQIQLLPARSHKVTV